MIVQRYMCSFEYNTRHFGTACDRGFQGLSMYHQSQKFGNIGSRLSPLPKNLVAELTDGEDVEEIPKDERHFYKKIYKHENMPVVALVKSFEIEWMKENEVNKKTSKSLILSFHLALQILNTHKDLVEFFSKNLQLLELNTVSLKNKGTHSLKSKVGRFSDDEFQQNYVIIPNSSGQGFFKINFPKLEIYFQEYQHVEVKNLSPMKFLDLIKDNFFQLQEMVSEIKIDYNTLEKYKQQRILQEKKFKEEQDLNIKQEVENIQKPIQENTNNQELEQQKTSRSNQINNEFGIIITEKKSEFPDKILIKRQIKHVVMKDEKSYYCVDFLPLQFIIREKVSQKIIKIYSPTFQEFNDFLIQLTTKNTKQIIDEYLVSTFDIPPEAFDYKEFKKGTKIFLNLPKSNDLCSEVTEEHLNNGLLQSYTKEIEINNKDLQIIMESCSFGIYNQTTCSMDRRLCSSKEITSILQKKYQIQFKLV